MLASENKFIDSKNTSLRLNQEIKYLNIYLLSTEQVYGWGNSRYGQVGTGNTGRYPRPTLLLQLNGIGIIHVACGQFHSLAVTSDGR